MSENRIDVVSVLDAAASDMLDARLQDEPLREVRDAIAELIEADREYDDAQFGLARARYNGEPLKPWIDGCAKADIRRAAALARVTPELTKEPRP